MLNLVLYQPDIPQNLGAVLRLSACLGCTVHVVEPCGFPFNHEKLRRVGMDYVDKATLVRHLNWAAFMEYFNGAQAARSLSASMAVSKNAACAHLPPLTLDSTIVDGIARRPQAEPLAAGVSASEGDKVPFQKPRLLLLETDGAKTYTDMAFTRTDYVVLGRESAGTPRELYAQMDETITIPMRPDSRSINVAMSAGLLVGEACRQLGWKF